MACEPCIRGHRSTTCNHEKERVMVPVRKPGRPLSDMPQPLGRASGNDAVTIAIPKKRKCECSVPKPSTPVSIGEDEPRKTSRRSFSQATPTRPRSPQPISMNGGSTVQQSAPQNLLGQLPGFAPSLNGFQYQDLIFQSSVPITEHKALSRTDDRSEVALNQGSDVVSRITPSFNPAESSSRPSCCGGGGAGGSTRSSTTKPTAPAASTNNPSPQPNFSSAPATMNASASGPKPNHHQFDLPVIQPASNLQSPINSVQHGTHLPTTPDQIFQANPSIHVARPSMQATAVTLPLCTSCLTHKQATILVQSPRRGSTMEAISPMDLPHSIVNASIIYVIVPNGPTTVAAPAPLQSPQQPPAASPSPYPPMSSMSETGGCGGQGLLHECHCGPSCQCIGCVAHPFNNATEQYVLSAYNNIFDSPVADEQDIQVYPEHPPSGDMSPALGPKPATNPVPALSAHDTRQDNDFLWVDYHLNLNLHNGHHHGNG